MNQDQFNKDGEREARIRARAYDLWEAAGRPHGRDVEFWQRARALVAAEEGAPARSTIVGTTDGDQTTAAGAADDPSAGRGVHHT